jgi:hypothetical protein
MDTDKLEKLFILILVVVLGLYAWYDYARTIDTLQGIGSVDARIAALEADANLAGSAFAIFGALMIWAGTELARTFKRQQSHNK